MSSYQLFRNRFSLWPQRMEFEPIPSEDDELIQAIENEIKQRDNSWVLEERPDPESLIRFWQEAVKE